MPKPANEFPKTPRRAGVETVIALVVTVLAVGLHLIFMSHAGALWRDEVNEVNLAAMPSLADAWQHDSFPVLWVLVLRIAASLGVSSDFGLRVLGCGIGIVTLGILWFAARRMKFSVPWISLLLLGFNSSIIRWGDSIRPWGLSLALILLTFAFIWSVVENGSGTGVSPVRLPKEAETHGRDAHATKPPSWKNFVLATIAAVGSVQCTYYNAVLLLAICTGGFAVTLRTRAWKTFWMVLGIGLIAAVSLVPYIGTIQRAMPIYLVMQQPEFGVGTFLARLGEALAPDGEMGKFGIFIWLALSLMAILTALVCQFGKSAFNATTGQKNLLLFALTTFLVGAVVYFLFLHQARLASQAWYYIALMAVAALAIDAMTSVWSVGKWGRILRIGIVLLAIGVTFLPLLKQVHLRQTNIDVIAADLNKVAKPNDFILVNPWYVGLSFQRYYHGASKWMTLPPIEDHKTHRYDLVKAAMQMRDQVEPMRPVFEQMEMTLKSGGRVWLVGGVRLMNDDELRQGRPILPPAPEGPDGWSDTAYYNEWSMQAAYLIQLHAQHIQPYNPEVGAPVSEHEFVGMGFAEGWKD